MATTERDKFLTDAMGNSWHTSVYTGAGNKCVCGKWWSECSKYHPSLSTWDGFGRLWEWASKQEWQEEFFYKVHGIHEHGDNLRVLISPDSFADAVYEFLNRRSKC